MNLSKAIQTYRTSLGLSLQKVADISGLTKTYLWEIESGKRIGLSPKTLMKLSSALGVEPTHLFECAVNSVLEEIDAKECGK